MKLTVHFLQYGHTPCLMETPPSTWPEHHKWTSNWDEVTCAACRKGREIAPTYEISADGKSFTCLRCKLTSHNPRDVENRYCGRCHAHHDDIWPPARRWWVNHPDHG